MNEPNKTPGNMKLSRALELLNALIDHMINDESKTLFVRRKRAASRDIKPLDALSIALRADVVSGFRNHVNSSHTPQR